MDPDKYTCVSPQPLSNPIATFHKGHIDIIPALSEAGMTVSVDELHVRVSPGIYNTEEDMRVAAGVLNGAG